MENTLSVTLMIVFLLIGAVGIGVFGPEKTEIKYVDRVEYVNNTVEKVVEISAPNQLDLALAKFSLAYEAEEDEAGNDFEAFDVDDYDKVSIKKVYDDYVVNFNEYGFIVDFDVKMRFEDNNDVNFDRYEVTVIFEDDEDTEVIANLV